ncbi:MAG TPA: hypothetical protein VGM56_12145 [Byssovorax sp.]
MAKPATSKAKKTRSAEKPKPTKPRPQDDRAPAQRAPFVTTDPRAAFDHFAPQAAAMTGDTPVLSFEVSVARHNVEVACAAFAPYLGDVKGLAPSVEPTRIAELPALALALEFAANAVPLAARSDGSIDAAMRELGQVRLDTLAYLEIAARRGLVDEGRVAKVRAGHGKLDFANDCVAIGGIFADAGAALAGKHPFTKDELDLLATKGAWLRGELTPGGAPRRPTERDPAAVTRDRLAKLLDDGYGELEKVAGVKWGAAALRDHIPLLRSRKGAKKKPPVPPPEPAAS